MLRVVTLCLCMSLFVIGCNKENNSEFTRYHDDGRAKPSVAIAHVIDSSNFDATWSLSDEFTDLVMNRIGYKGQLFIPDYDQPDLVSSQNPFGSNLSWVKNHYENAEFVIFLELVQHESDPICDSNAHNTLASIQEHTSNLNMKIRLRVIDIRHEPTVVLQEMINDTYYLAKNTMPVDYDLTPWGVEGYSTSPLGMAHTQIVKEIVERAQTYILLAKSK